MRFERGEYFLIVLIACLLVACLGLSLVKQVDVDLAAFRMPLVFNIAFLAIGQFYRTVRQDERLATIVTSIGLLMISGHVLKAFTYLLLPYQFHGADQLLANVDSALGFEWSVFVTAMAKYPAFCSLLKSVYLSCAWQIALVVLMLGLLGKTAEITKFMLAIVLGGVITLEVWSLFPSSTPAAFQPLAPEVAALLGLVVSPEQGSWLVKISFEGVRKLSPNDLVGIVGFPSYHTVLAVVSVSFARQVRYLFYPLLMLNALMLPAILVHGSHNLIDVLGGLAVSAVSIWLVGKIVQGRPALVNAQSVAV
jgi:PAP2 superfamily